MAILAVLLLTSLISACQSSPTPTPLSPTRAPAASTPAAPPTSAAAKATAPASALLDACVLLTKDDVQSAIGKPVKSVKEDADSATATSCGYKDAATQSYRLVSLVIYPSTNAQAKGVHESTRTKNRPQVAVANLGDDAYWDMSLGTLDVLKGKYSIGLFVAGDAANDQVAAARSMASKLLSRLP